jgi:glutamate racemase
VERFANGVELFPHTCPGLVQQIEQGNLKGEETRKILQDALLPMLEKQIDTVVLGCTHYPFVIPLIQEIVGGARHIRVIDPAPAVAKQTGRVLDARGLRTKSTLKGNITFYTSGDPSALKSLLRKLLGETAKVRKVHWRNDSSLEEI